MEKFLKQVAEDGVRFVCFQFTDVVGAVKSVDIPISRLESVLADGIWFDGSSVEGFARIQESDMRLVPDTSTYAVLPWSSEETRRARVICDVYTPEGDPFPGDPRYVLKRQLARVEERGWRYNVGTEPEFFLVKSNDGESLHPVPHDVGGYFDFSASDEAQQVRTRLMSALDQMGLEVEMGHHEVALGQHEIDFHFADALRTADNVVTLKYTVRALAAKHGLIATFMPKPFFGINGSGMHTHQSISNNDGKNIFYNADDTYMLSKEMYQFMAGQMAHARGLAAIVAPTVNSYKRIVPGYEAPVYVCWAQINRSAMIRIPSQIGSGGVGVRAELRFPDPSCNPYLAFAAMLAAGLDGIERDLECPGPVNHLNIFEMDQDELLERGILQLPGSLQEALDALAEDKVLIDALGQDTYDVFHRAKRTEWQNFSMQVTDWEIEQYLETA